MPNEVEKAIKRLESCSIIPFDEDCQQVCNLAISALEKQTPKKPTQQQINPHGELIGLCSKCQNWWINKFEHYCPNCGQALDWSGENDD